MKDSIWKFPMFMVMSIITSKRLENTSKNKYIFFVNSLTDSDILEGNDLAVAFCFKMQGKGLFL